MFTEYERGFFNGLLVFFFGYNFITGAFFVMDGLRARAVSQTYEIIEMQFSIVGMGLLFLISSVMGVLAYFRNDQLALLFMMISSFMNIGLMIYYGYTLLTVEPLTVIAWRYLYIGCVHFAMFAGGVAIWYRKKKKTTL